MPDRPTALAVAAPAPLAPQLSAADAELLRDLWAGANAPATVAAYRADWRLFCVFCEHCGATSTPAHPVTVALYIADLATRYRYASIHRKVAAISWVHRALKVPSPTRTPEVRAAMASVARRIGTAPERQKRAIDLDLLRRMVRTIPLDTPTGARDRALLLVGYFGAFRRSEHTSIRAGQIEWVSDGAMIHLRRSKTNQTGKAELIPLASRPEEPEMCPVLALRRWIDHIQAGPEDSVFCGYSRGLLRDQPMHSQEVNRLVKRCLSEIGVDPTRYGAHSLRAGFVTQARRDGIPDAQIQTVTRQSITTLSGYYREDDLIRHSAASKIGRAGGDRSKVSAVVRSPARRLPDPIEALIPSDATADLHARLSDGSITVETVTLPHARKPIGDRVWAWIVQATAHGIEVEPYSNLTADDLLASLARGVAVLHAAGEWAYLWRRRD